MRNLGNKTSVLKRATAHVSDWRIISMCGPGASLPVSSTYEITLPQNPEKPKFDVSTEMSDFLKPNEATRIRIKTGLDVKSPSMDGILFRLTLELSFDESAKVISDPVIISLPSELSPPQEWEAMQQLSGSQGECANQNLEDLKYMLGLSGRRDKDLELITDDL